MSYDMRAHSLSDLVLAEGILSQFGRKKLPSRTSSVSYFILSGESIVTSFHLVITYMVCRPVYYHALLPTSKAYDS